MGPEEKFTFEEIKKQLAPKSLLVHYDLDAKLILTCDAPPYKVGVKLSHQLKDVVENLITFAS